MPIDVLRTPEDRFGTLPGFPYQPNYVDDLSGYEGLRMAVIDEGPKDAPVFLCLHGEPSWSYLYRKMIPYFLEAGGRCVAPDLFGFGRSDKPTKRDDYSHTFHRNSLLALVEKMDLQNVTLVVQDWGGILGLTLPMEAPERYKRLIIMNTALPMEPEASVVAKDLFERPEGTAPTTGFGGWHAFSQSRPSMNCGGIIARGCGAELSAEEIAAYDAPFPDETYQAGALVFPTLVPWRSDMEGYAISQRAIEFWNQWDGQTFMAVGDQDPVLGVPMMERMRDLIKGCPDPVHIKGGGHFVQERGDEIAPAALQAFGGK
ncbi:MAG: haloalkane dehalogenase [Pseudomonadota bacterium]